MKFTAQKMEAISNRFEEKKRAKPIKKHVIGLGIKLVNAMDEAAIVNKDNWVFASVEELDRMIVELQMLKDAIEEETGLII